MPCALVDLGQSNAKDGELSPAFIRAAGLIAAQLPPDRAEAFKMLCYVRAQAAEWFDSPPD
jgi:hypothetical protein